MNTMRNPLLLIILNYLVGAMVARGVIEPNDHNSVVEMLADVVGLAIILLTTLVSLFKVIKHRSPEDITHTIIPALTVEQHGQMKELLTHMEPTATATKETTIKVTEVIDPGTPLPSDNTLPFDPGTNEQGTPPKNP